MISDKDKQKIFEADLANIVRKVKAGKPLTKYERAIIEAAEKSKSAETKPDKGAKTAIYVSIAQAASAMGLPKRVLQKAKRDGCPGFQHSRVDSAAVLDWLRERNITKEIKAAESREDADRRWAVTRADRKAFELSVLKRDYIPAEEVKRTFTRVIIACKTRLLSIPTTLAPRLALQTDAVECEALVKTAIFDALTELSKCPWVEVEKKK